jgi:hypothetical protein
VTDTLLWAAWWVGSDETVKVPQMAESISEGTLKTWQKKVGDTVAVDEEVATIETDKVCHATTHPDDVFLSLVTRLSVVF